MTKTPETVQIGDAVAYMDEVRKEHAAIVTEVWGRGVLLDGKGTPDPKQQVSSCINVVFVSGNEAEKDQYGRQIKHETSVSHMSTQSAGRFWK